MNSSPASKAVRLVSCRRIEHLHLADADLGIDRDVRDALAGRRKRGVTIDAHPTVVLVEEPHLTHAGVPVQLDDDAAGNAYQQVPEADGGLHGFGGAAIEGHVREIEAQLADAEVGLVWQ